MGEVNPFIPRVFIPWYSVSQCTNFSDSLVAFIFHVFMKFQMPLLVIALPWSLLADDGVRFNRDVRPILSENCFACHGQDAKKRKAKLRLDQRDGALVDRDGKRAIVPGKLETSELWRRINARDQDEVMPPPKSHKTLTAADKDILRRWIQQGAKYEGHWSFQAPKKQPVPKVAGVDNAIDAFLQDRLRREAL